MNLNNFLDAIKDSNLFKSFYNQINPKKPFKITGLTEGLKPFWLQALLENINSTLLIVVSSKEEEDTFISFFEYIGYKDFDLFPTLEISPYELVLTDVGLLDKQYKVIDKLLRKEAKCIITKTRGLNQKLLTLDDLSKNVLTIQPTKEVSPTKLAEELVYIGYKSTFDMEEKGTFSKKGSSMIVYPIGFEHPIKIEWFDDEIESIRIFDIQNKVPKNNISLVTFYPASKMVIPKNQKFSLKNDIMKVLMEQVAQIYSKGLRKNAEDLRKKVEEDIEKLKNYQYDESTYSYFNFLYQESFSLIDYLPKNSTIIWSEFTNQNLTLKKFEETTEESLKKKAEKGLLLKTPDKIYLTTDEILKKSRNFSQVRFSTLSDMPNVDIEFKGTMLPVLEKNLDPLSSTLKEWSVTEKKKIIIVTLQPQRALTILRERDCQVAYNVDPDFGNNNQGGIWVLKGQLKKGFVYPDLNSVILTDSEIFGWKQKVIKQHKSEEKTKHPSVKLNKIQDLKINDYVVHEVHGIGQYRGFRTIELSGIKREYFEVIYAKEDKLLVPIEQINLLSLYRGSADAPPRLSKMGGGEWEKLKNRVKESVRNIAGDLIELYAKRRDSKGFAFPLDSEWQREMEDAFPYEETEDQLRAILETKSDMEKDTPMDRLVCGDVGFGKTEVAIRAGFKSIDAGKQVAVLAPTTVLSQQLYDVFRERFSPYPIKIAILNRFRSTSETKAIYESLKKGDLDAIVSTHRILLKVPEFFDLGLIIIDEEHKFGVAHKEKLKQFKTSVDVLAMSATPIPRTLHMSLSGARDMSLIETPPQNRFPVISKLTPYSKEIVKNAILHELERGGQVYFVHNRVQSIYKLYEELKEILPDVRVAVGHGQLPEHELENVMLGFNNREFDVLLCTTIIESGLDIPTANTIIIDQAQLLGLAQLYQLKGRVGRSDIQAYAYFLYPENQKLTDEARQRLQVIQEMNELGSGYQVALKDMEIRGVGDLLGADQHGHILSVGYDTYCQILEEAVNELKPEGERTDLYSPNNVVIDINLPCYIPDSLTDNYRLKMQFYRRLAVVHELDLLDEIRKDMEKAFEKIPSVTENLLKIVKIRILASKLAITSIKLSLKTIKIKYKLPEMIWRSFVSRDMDLMRWQWSLEEITTKSSNTPENDLIIIEKFLNAVIKLIKKEKEEDSANSKKLLLKI